MDGPSDTSSRVPRGFEVYEHDPTRHATGISPNGLSYSGVSGNRRARFQLGADYCHTSTGNLLGRDAREK